jgi:hypothetical protein
MEARGTLPATARRTIEDLLSARFGAPVRIAGVQPFPPFRVWRCAIRPAGGGVPATVIVRLPRDPGDARDTRDARDAGAARDDPARAGLARLANEHAALELLGSLGSGLAPGVVAGGAGPGLLVTEDLGTHPSLLDLLLGGDAAAAGEGLLAFARDLGALHAQTSGRAPEYDARRAGLGPPDPDATRPDPRASVLASWRRVRDAVSALGLPEPGGAVDVDVDAVGRTLAAPGAYLALSSGDPSAVNCQVAGGAVRFFDFETAGFRHALIDASVLRFLYPTGGPVWRLPRAVAGLLEPAYRNALAPACPSVLDDAGYERGMAAASAAWALLRMVRLPRVEAGPDRDAWSLLPPGWAGPVPTRSRRRQLLSIVETGIAAMHRAGAFDALAAWCGRVGGALRTRWPEAAEEIPLYPAFEAPRR